MSGRMLVFDCFSGIAGDMTLAALIDAGASLDTIRDGLASLELSPFELLPERVMRSGLAATYLRVDIPREERYQPDEMRSKVRAAGFLSRVEARTLDAIDALASGEAAAHAAESPHFHEVGGVDALIDIAGTMLGLEALGIDEAFCPVVTVGSGTIVRSEHGAIPAAPGPAAAAILTAAGFPMRFAEASHELVTPTGAAILAAVTQPRAATLRVTASGAGAGTADPPGRPNALRIFIGEAAAAVSIGAPSTRPLVELSANIDDMTPALLAHARDRLLAEGALDAWLEPIGMKKGRSATRLCALVGPEDEAGFAALFLRETTTLGVRVASYRRYEADRRVETLETSFGPIRVKVSEGPAGRRFAPEWEDVRALAERLGRPALEIQRELERELGT